MRQLLAKKPQVPNTSMYQSGRLGTGKANPKGIVDKEQAKQIRERVLSIIDILVMR